MEELLSNIINPLTNQPFTDLNQLTNQMANNDSLRINFLEVSVLLLIKKLRSQPRLCYYHRAKGLSAHTCQGSDYCDEYNIEIFSIFHSRKNVYTRPRANYGNRFNNYKSNNKYNNSDGRSNNFQRNNRNSNFNNRNIGYNNRNNGYNNRNNGYNNQNNYCDQCDCQDQFFKPYDRDNRPSDPQPNSLSNSQQSDYQSNSPLFNLQFNHQANSNSNSNSNANSQSNSQSFH